MDLAGLRAAVAADRRAGHRPFLVAANAGSVKTGAIDPLDDLADFCRAEGLWLHVDGAYGGFGALDPRLADWYAGLERADSVALDPHKWLAVAIGCSCAMVRQGQLLQDTYKLVPSYLSLPTGPGFAGEVWYSHRSAEQTRDSGRALKTLWNIQQAGKAGLVDHVQRHIDLARYLEEVIEASPDLELLAAGPLTAVCFRYVPPGGRDGEPELTLLNQAIMEDVQVGGRAFLAGVDIGGRFALRSCALHYALDEGHVQAIVDAVRTAGQRRVHAGPASPPRASGGGCRMRTVTGRPAGFRADTAAPPRAGQARFTLALAAGKAAGAASRALRAGGGTNFSGIVASRIDPRVLQKVAAASDARQGDRHRQQRQDDDLPDARRPGQRRRPPGHPEPDRLQPAAGSDLGGGAGD